MASRLPSLPSLRKLLPSFGNSVKIGAGVTAATTVANAYQSLTNFFNDVPMCYVIVGSVIVGAVMYGKYLQYLQDYVHRMRRANITSTAIRRRDNGVEAEPSQQGLASILDMVSLQPHPAILAAYLQSSYYHLVPPPVLYHRLPQPPSLHHRFPHAPVSYYHLPPTLATYPFPRASAMDDYLHGASIVVPLCSRGDAMDPLLPGDAAMGTLLLGQAASSTNANAMDLSFVPTITFLPTSSVGSE